MAQRKTRSTVRKGKSKTRRTVRKSLKSARKRPAKRIVARATPRKRVAKAKLKGGAKKARSHRVQRHSADHAFGGSPLHAQPGSAHVLLLEPAAGGAAGRAIGGRSRGA